MVESTKGHPPTTLMVITVVIAERPYMMLRPKLSERLLSIPAQGREYEAQEPTMNVTFNVFTEPVEKTAARHRIVESDIRKQNRFQKALVDDMRRMDRAGVQDEPTERCQHKTNSSDNGIYRDVVHGVLCVASDPCIGPMPKNVRRAKNRRSRLRTY